MEYLVAIAIIFGIGFVVGIFLKGKAQDYAHNRQLREQLNRKEKELERRELGFVNGLKKREKDSVNGLEKREKVFVSMQNLRKSILDKREVYLTSLDNNFKKDFCTGREWLAEFIADAEKASDKERENYLENKSHPALKAAEVVSQIKNEKRDLLSKLKFAEYQIKSYEEYFPFLEEFKEVILEERVPLGNGRDNKESLEKIDPVRHHITKEEWERLSTTEKNQLALDRYLKRNKSNWEIGLMYERYLGYLWERVGYKVEYNGAIKGYEDFGRDLICSKDSLVSIVQAKCWSKHKIIHEKHIFQLYATTLHYQLEQEVQNVKAYFTTTTNLSKTAMLVAETLNVNVDKIPLPQSWPIIKCNINPTTKEKIYHLPFDQQYDRAAIGPIAGECYASSVAEAEALGFRRAFRYMGGA